MILATGSGTRFQSPVPKLLAPVVQGQGMLELLLRLLLEEIPGDQLTIEVRPMPPGTSHPRQLQPLPVQLRRAEAGDQVAAVAEGGEAGVGAEEGGGQLVAEQQGDGGGRIRSPPAGSSSR